MSFAVNDAMFLERVAAPTRETREMTRDDEMREGDSTWRELGPTAGMGYRMANGAIDTNEKRAACV